MCQKVLQWALDVFYAGVFHEGNRCPEVRPLGDGEIRDQQVAKAVGTVGVMDQSDHVKPFYGGGLDLKRKKLQDPFVRLGALRSRNPLSSPNCFVPFRLLAAG